MAATALGLILLFLVFFYFPEVDLVASQFFYKGDHSFIWSSPNRTGDALRNIFYGTFVAGTTFAAGGVIFGNLARLSFLTQKRTGYFYVVLCNLLGPGLLTNALLKEHWGRARPRDVDAFGGLATFSDPMTISSQCQHNCSFISGEASSIYMLFFSYAFIVAPPYRSAVIVAGAIAGTGAGVMRVAQGGHFLSDVLFGGLLMFFSAIVIRAVFRSVLLAIIPGMKPTEKISPVPPLST